MNIPVSKILLTALCITLFTTTIYAQAPEIRGKIEALLKKKTPDTKVAVNTVTHTIAIQEIIQASVYDFTIPLQQVANEYSYRIRNGVDTMHEATINCAKGESCITVSVNAKKTHTKTIKLSFDTRKDAVAFTKLMDRLKKQK